MKEYSKIIESLNVKFLQIKTIKILQDVTIENFYDTENMLIMLNSGTLSFEYKKKEYTLNQGDILFIPGGKELAITYGEEKKTILTNEYFLNNRWKYFQPIHEPEYNASFTNVSYLNFDAKIFNSVNFFLSLNIPPFVIVNGTEIQKNFKEILNEKSVQKIGYEKIVLIATELIVIEMFRYMIDNHLFTDKLATNSNYFKDPRLIDIFNYVNANLEKDLSNKVLSTIANVSEDYVGQYFKMLTGINPQDYIEYQRMEKAVKLLRGSKKSIREIGEEVGFRDTAYFCRRFKMMFGIPAGKMRRRELKV